MTTVGRVIHDRRDLALRAMYAGGRGNATARRFAAVWAWAFGKGLVPGRRWVTLEVPGRTTGNPTRFPVGIATVDGQDYLCSMLGNNCNWVRNVRAHDGRAIIERRRRHRIRLTEIPEPLRPPLLKAYLQQVPGARPHIGVHHTQPVSDFAPIAAHYPVFRIDHAPADTSSMPPQPGMSQRRWSRGHVREACREVVSSLEGAARIAGALVARPLRGQRTTWGATAGEIAAHYPGDDLVPHPRWGYTHAVDVGAPPKQVWPWVVQIGQGRGGFYSYQGLENLVGCRIRNTRHIQPAFQSLAVGDEIRLHPRAPGLRVRICEPNQSLVLVGGDDGAPAMSLWAFHLINAPGGRTRLIERGAYTHGPSMSERFGFGPTFLEPISFVMSRKMLLTIADLAGPPVYRVQGWRSVANRVMSLALTAGVAPPQMVLLHTTGRTSGQVRATPVYVTDHDSHRYLVAPYGAVGWVHNLRADPTLTLRRGTTTEAMRAEEVTDTATAAAVLARYHSSVKASRPFFQATPGAGADELAAETHLHPVFTLRPATARTGS